MDDPGAMSIDPAASMERALAMLVRLRATIQARLAERFGPRQWQAARSVREFTRAAADDGAPAGAETVSLGTVYFAGTYPDQHWRPAADVVARTGQEFGFTQMVIHQDSPEGIAFTGQHPAGHNYRFGIGATTVLSVQSGPAVWAGTPYLSADQVMAAATGAGPASEDVSSPPPGTGR